MFRILVSFNFRQHTLLCRVKYSNDAVKCQRRLVAVSSTVARGGMGHTWRPTFLEGCCWPVAAGGKVQSVFLHRRPDVSYGQCAYFICQETDLMNGNDICSRPHRRTHRHTHILSTWQSWNLNLHLCLPKLVPLPLIGCFPDHCAGQGPGCWCSPSPRPTGHDIGPAVCVSGFLFLPL